MTIVIDLLHPAHLNFFRNAIENQKSRGIDINIIYRSRGNIKGILMHDIPEWNFTQIGEHHKVIYRKLFALFNREYNILKYLRDQDFELVTGIAGFYVGFPAKLMAKSAVSFTDDWEYKTTFYLSKYCSDYLVVPQLIPDNDASVLKYPGYKELAYLHPKYYKPTEKAIRASGLKKNKYVFVRLVSPVSLNYLKINEGNLKKTFDDIKDLGYDIVLSPESAGYADQYSDTCHILEPPIADIHSWLSHAALTLTFGDTIARESALLGTPVVYLGGRDMVINSELIEMGCLRTANPNSDLSETIRPLLNASTKKNATEKVRKAMDSNHWMDTTQVIIDIWTAVLEDNQELINKYR